MVGIAGGEGGPFFCVNSGKDIPLDSINEPHNRINLKNAVSFWSAEFLLAFPLFSFNKRSGVRVERIPDTERYLSLFLEVGQYSADRGNAAAVSFSRHE